MSIVVSKELMDFFRNIKIPERRKAAIHYLATEELGDDVFIKKMKIAEKKRDSFNV